jgi:hypothetical protein
MTGSFLWWTEQSITAQPGSDCSLVPAGRILADHLLEKTKVTETVVAEGLISAPNPHALCQVVNHDYRQMLKAARGAEIIVEAERELYVARLECCLRKAMARADGYGANGEKTLSPMIQYLNLQLAATSSQRRTARSQRNTPWRSRERGIPLFSYQLWFSRFVGPTWT